MLIQPSFEKPEASPAFEKGYITIYRDQEIKSTWDKRK